MLHLAHHSSRVHLHYRYHRQSRHLAQREVRLEEERIRREIPCDLSRKVLDLEVVDQDRAGPSKVVDRLGDHRSSHWEEGFVRTLGKTVVVHVHGQSWGRLIDDSTIK